MLLTRGTRLKARSPVLKVRGWHQRARLKPSPIQERVLTQGLRLCIRDAQELAPLDRR
jgi:hypothetical protein